MIAATPFLRKTLLSVLACCLLAFPFAVQPKEAAPLADDPAAEKRLRSLSEEFRCLVCQNQSIADSNADLAVDLRREIRSMIHEGKSDSDIKDFMVTRYGDFVLYRPPLEGATLLLWFGPGLLFIIALVALRSTLRRRDRTLAAERELSPEEQQKAEALLRAATDTPPKE
ncbi:MAG: cytochrome c-type biogenesis protein CcmH [Betaproteobacteria bacterium]|nr:cytochrome c-type biogenesis protein CcmH [Betaproteobacteria bacterium]